MSTTAQPIIDTSDEALQRIFQAAEGQADDAGQIGDREIALRAALARMSPDQRAALMESDYIKGVLASDDESE